MSWSISVPVTPRLSFRDAVDAAVESNEIEDKYMLDQVSLARDAIITIAESGAVGTGLISAEISGHANPNHAPTPGWSHDFISIRITCAEPYP
jgi:hypothetical protein